MLLEEGLTPLVVAYDISLASFILLAYGERCSRDGTSSRNSRSTPYLVEKKLDSLPNDLLPYLASFPIRPGTHYSKFYSSNRTSSNSTLSSLESSSPVTRPTTQHSSTLQPPILNESFLQQSYPPHLKYITIINSVHDGSQQSSDVYFSILVPLLKRFGVSHVYVATSSPQTIPNHAKSFSSSSTVLFLAGDTSISEFVNSLIDQPLARRLREPNSTPTTDPLHLNLMCIPTGHSNSISRSIGHLSIAKAISRIFIGELQPLANFQVVFPPGSSLVASSSLRSSNSCLPAYSTIPLGPQPTAFHTLSILSWEFHARKADTRSPDRQSNSQERHAQEHRNPGAIYIQQNEQIHAVQVSPHNHPKNASPSTSSSSLIGFPHSNVLTLGNGLGGRYIISPESKSPTSRDLHLVRYPYMDNASLLHLIEAPYPNAAHPNTNCMDHINISPTPAVPEDVPVLAVTVSPEAQDTQGSQPWSFDGQIVQVPAVRDPNNQEQKVRIYTPTYICNGWKLFIVV